jgi:monofunctional glycosyltransferase
MPPVCRDPPSLTDLIHANPRQTSFMREDRRRGHSPAQVSVGAWVPLADVAPSLVAAVIRSEDPRFFDHHGVDWQAIADRIRTSVRDGRLDGGASTITQQLARNLYLTPARSLVRKLREMWLAWRLDRLLSKGRVLEVYLNVVEWGRGHWGCAAASMHYFGKAPRDLDLFESTFLATLLPAPKAGLSGGHAARSRRVQVTVAHQLLFAGLKSPEECAVCCARVRELHRLLDTGMQLLTALTASSHVTTSADAGFVRAVIADLAIVPAASVAVLADRACEARLRAAFTRLCERFGAAAVREVLATGSYAPLRTPSHHISDSR